MQFALLYRFRAIFYSISVEGVLLLLVGACQAPQEAVISAPNIVLIMADDLGYGGLGCYGNDDIATPYLDSLAKGGIRFTDFHANAPVCTPTRASLLTGNYPQRSGLEGVIYVKGETRQVGLDTSQTTLAELLRDNGYATGIMGKWHLGYRPEYNPVHHGFDEFYGYVSGNIDYHSHYDNAGIYDWWHNLDTIREEGYSTDLITQHAVKFIQQHQKRPFFLYVAHEAPHVPFQGRSDPAYRFPDTTFTYYGPVEDRHATYRAMVAAMDEGVGRIMKTLHETGLEENTLVFFLSDNGALAEYGNNGELSGHKSLLEEGGHRVPAIAYWKNQIKPGTSPETLMSMDLLPTLLSLTQTNVPEKISFDGLDFSALLTEGDSIAQRPLFWRYRQQKAVRQGHWKLLVTDADTALYHLGRDILESDNVYDRMTKIARNLHRQLDQWESSVADSVPLKTR